MVPKEQMNKMIFFLRNKNKQVREQLKACKISRDTFCFKISRTLMRGKVNFGLCRMDNKSTTLSRGVKCPTKK